MLEQATPVRVDVKEMLDCQLKKEGLILCGIRRYSQWSNNDIFNELKDERKHVNFFKKSILVSNNPTLPSQKSNGPPVIMKRLVLYLLLTKNNSLLALIGRNNEMAEQNSF